MGDPDGSLEWRAQASNSTCRSDICLLLVQFHASGQRHCSHRLHHLTGHFPGSRHAHHILHSQGAHIHLLMPDLKASAVNLHNLTLSVYPCTGVLLLYMRDASDAHEDMWKESCDIGCLHWCSTMSLLASWASHSLPAGSGICRALHQPRLNS